MFIQFLLLVFYCIRFYSALLILFDKKLFFRAKIRAFLISICKTLASMVVFKLCNVLSTYLKNLTLKKNN